MAKRRKKSSGRRGRVGSISTRGSGYTGLMIIAAGAIAGASVAVYAGNMLGDKVPPKGKALGQLAAGAIIANQARQPFIQGVGLGMMTAGGTTLLKSTGILSGTGDDAMYIEDGMSGDDDYMSGAGEDYRGPLDVMSGDDVFGG